MEWNSIQKLSSDYPIITRFVSVNSAQDYIRATGAQNSNPYFLKAINLAHKNITLLYLVTTINI